jgi:hypothetical protein
MNRAVGSASPGFSAWLWFAFLMGAAVLVEVSAIRAADLGLAISGLGLVLLAAFSFLCPLPFNVNVRSILTMPANVPPGVAIIGGIGALLNVVGVLIRWFG